GDHVRQFRRRRNAIPGLLLERLKPDGHAPVGSLGVVLNLRIQPVARGADAPLRIVLRGKRFARAERHERANSLFRVMRVDLMQHLLDRDGEEKSNHSRAMSLSAEGRSAAPIATLMMSAITNGTMPIVHAARGPARTASHAHPPA